MGALQLPKFAHPDFSRPYNRPTGPMVANPKWLRRGMRHLWMLGERGSPQDLCQKDAWSTLSGTNPAIVGTDKGKASDFDGATNYLDTPDNFSFGSEGTTIGYARCDSTATGPALTGAGNNDNQIRVTGSGVVAYRPTSATPTIAVNAGAVGDWRVFAGGFDGVDIFVYASPRWYSTVANANTPASTNPITIGARASGGSWHWNGPIMYVAYFDARLAKFELDSLYRNPFDLVLPAVNALYFTEDAAAATSGNPWYHYANQ